jgi:hypothetical protein
MAFEYALANQVSIVILSVLEFSFGHLEHATRNTLGRFAALNVRMMHSIQRRA